MSQIPHLKWATLARQRIASTGGAGLVAAFSHLVGQLEMATILEAGRWGDLPKMLATALDYGQGRVAPPGDADANQR